jgi:hypothetical protein
VRLFAHASACSANLATHVLLKSQNPNIGDRQKSTDKERRGAVVPTASFSPSDVRSTPRPRPKSKSPLVKARKDFRYSAECDRVYDRLSLNKADVEQFKASGVTNDWTINSRQISNVENALVAYCRKCEKQTSHQPIAPQRTLTPQEQEQSMAIYRLHPKQISRRRSLIAIQESIERDGLECVTEGTRAYGRLVPTWSENDKRFAFGSLKFFQDDHYADSQWVWEKKASVVAKHEDGF